MEFTAANGRFPPGFRFHPTDVELVMHHLKRKVLGKTLEPALVAEVDIYQFHPEDLRQLAYLNEDMNLFFFCTKAKKYGCGARTNRATQTGFWKSTGNGRPVTYRERTVGEVKSLVFHQGKSPRGERTDWVMHEYRLEDSELTAEKVPHAAFVLCKVFKKGGLGPRNGDQYGSPYNEEDWDSEPEETLNHTPTAPVADQVQIASVNGSFSVQACPLQTSVQVNSGPVSVSIPDEAHTLTSYGSNVASTSKVVALDVADIASTSKSPSQNDDDDVDILLSGFRFDNYGDIYDDLKDLFTP